VPQPTKLSAVAPTINDDASIGIFNGDYWYDYVTDKEYVCVDNTVGAASWRWSNQGSGGDTSNFARRQDEPNTYNRSQTVTPYEPAISIGEVNWDLELGQNAELSVTEAITDWYMPNGEAGRAITLRLYCPGNYSVTWPTSQFKNMNTFVLPASGNVTQISFRMKTYNVLEYIGQGPEFAEWDF
jgi:hypothetical protein